MANNRMYLLNRKTGERVYIAKYYPSTGWFSDEGVRDRLNNGFDRSDFCHLSQAEREAKVAFFGPPYANYDPANLMYGDQWELEYENTTQVQ